MAVIVGLGNPGPAYRLSRHNTGAMVARALAAHLGIRLIRRVGPTRVGEGWLGDHPVVISVPQTFMNESGSAVAALLARWPVPLTQLLVICDDVALPFGTVRIRPQGSDGGHRGLQSVIRAVASSAFPRLRIGISNSAGGERVSASLDRFVLAPFTGEEHRRLPAVLEAAVTACTVWVQQGVAMAMNRYNRRVSPD